MFVIKNICRLIGNVSRPIIDKCLFMFYLHKKLFAEAGFCPTKGHQRQAEGCCFGHIVGSSPTSSWMNQNPGILIVFVERKKPFRWEGKQQLLRVWSEHLHATLLRFSSLKTTRWCRSTAHLGELCGHNIWLSETTDERSLGETQRWTKHTRLRSAEENLLVLPQVNFVSVTSQVDFVGNTKMDYCPPVN